MNWDKLLLYILDRAREASTWKGIILVVTAITGFQVPTEKAAAIALIGMTFAGLVGMILPDRVPPKPPEEKT